MADIDGFGDELVRLVNKHGLDAMLGLSDEVVTAYIVTQLGVLKGAFDAKKTMEEN